MSLRRIISLLLFVLVIVLIDLLWFSSIPGLRIFLNISLLTIIALTIGEHFLVGLGAAIIFAIMYSQFSVLNGSVYMMAFIMAAVTSWIFSRKIVTSRSMISFLSTIMVGTASFTLALVVGDLLASVVNRQRLHIDIPSALVAGTIQMIIHPLLLGSIWRLFGRHQYHRITSFSTPTF